MYLAKTNGLPNGQEEDFVLDQEDHICLDQEHGIVLNHEEHLLLGRPEQQSWYWLSGPPPPLSQYCGKKHCPGTLGFPLPP